MSVRSVLVVLATSTALAVGGTALLPPRATGSVAAAPEWGPVTTLAPTTRGESLAVAPDGAVTVVWATTGTTPGQVVARHRPAGGSWGAAEVIGHGYAPRVTADETGDVTAVWLTQSRGRTDGVAAARRPAGGTWSRPTHLSRDREVPGYRPGSEDVFGATQLDLAAGAGGQVAVVWAWGSAGRDRPWRVQAVRRPAGGPWGHPVAVTPADWSSAPQVGVDAGGTTVVAWGRQPFGHPQKLLAREHRPGTGWTSPDTVASQGYAPELAVDRAGEAVLAYSTDDAAVAAAVKPAGGTWESPQRLSPAGVEVGDFALATNGAGASVVALGRSGGRVDVVDRAVGGAWTAPDPVVRSQAPVYDVLVALDDAGDTFLGWGAYGL